MFQTSSNISLKTSVKNITQAKSITPITIMSLGLGVTLLLTDRKSTRLNSSHPSRSRMPSSA